MFVFFYLYGEHRDLPVLTHSFPTRRASDLRGGRADVGVHPRSDPLSQGLQCGDRGRGVAGVQQVQAGGDGALGVRSEEHTSELQSLMRISYAVFCLKKKNTTQSI